MPIIISCAQCGRRLKAADKLAGRRVRCACGNVVQVPAAGPQIPVAEPPAAAAGPAVPAGEPAETPAVVLEGPEPTGVREKHRMDAGEIGQAARGEQVGGVDAGPLPDGRGSESGGEGGACFLGFDLAGLRGSLPTAVGGMLVAVGIGGALLFGGVYLLSRMVAGMDGMAPGSTGTPRFAIAPGFLAALFGMGFGFAVGKATTSRSGLVGWPAWAVGTAGVVLLLGIGSLAGQVFFTGGAPTILSMCLFLVGVMSMIGICVYAFWLG